MLSKWKIWDFVKNTPKGISASNTGLNLFYSFDPIINSMIKESFDKSLFENNSLVTFQGKEITTTWIDDNFKSLGLFGNSDSFCITKAEEISKEIKDILQTDELLLDNRFLVLFFEKNDDLFKKLAKKDNVNVIKIDAPAFWEYDKLLDFFASYKKVRLSFEAKQQIIEFVEPTCINFYNLMTKLAVNFDGEEISKSMLEEVLEKNKLDNFEMANLFGFKKMNAFYSKLIDLDPDFESLRGLFYFLQTHMVKISDPAFIQKKPKPSKYDNQILTQSRLWKQNELILVLDFLKNLESRAKVKNPYVKTDIKSAYYRSL